MRRFQLLLLWAFVAKGFALDNVQVKATATQAVLAYSAPDDGSACQLQVSQWDTLSPLVYDVDPALFTGSDQDSRPGNGLDANGKLRYFVVGKRRSDKATDGKLYSRALQAFTKHYYRLTCGSDSVTGEFSTKNPELGNNYPEIPPFDSSGFGNYAWPTIDWNDLDKRYIDPMTGIELKRASAPGWYGRQRQNVTFGFAMEPSGTWTNSANVLSGKSSSLASYSGSTKDPLYLGLDPDQHIVQYTSISSNGWYPQYTYDDLRLRLFGTGTSSSPDNRTVSACLSYFDSGATCNSGTIDIVLPQSGGSTGVTAPSNYPQFPYAGWGGTAPKRTDFAASRGNVDVAGTAVTLLNAGTGPGTANRFNLNWKLGAKIYIAGSSCPNNICTIASVQDSSHLTLQEDIGTLSNAVYKSLASVVKIWKKTDTGSVSVSANYDAALSSNLSLPLNGSISFCSDASVSVNYAADGTTPITPVDGRLCVNGQILFLLVPSTGETRLLALLDFIVEPDNNPADHRNGTLNLPTGGFDRTDGRVFYGWSTTGSSREYISIFKLRYDGNFKAYSHPLYPKEGIQPGQDPAIVYPWGPYADQQVTCVNITRPSEGKDLRSQFIANNPQWDSTIFSGINVPFINNGVAVITAGLPGESIGLIAFFDLAAGRITASGDSWTTYPARWGAVHSVGLFSGWANYALNPLGFARGYNGDSNYIGIGPWESTPTQVYKNGAWSSNTSLTPSDVTTCSLNLPQWIKDQGAVGNRCLKIRAPQVCSHTPHTAERAKWPCPTNSAWSHLQDTGVGDWFEAFNSDGRGLEFMMIVSQVDLGTGQWEFEVMRNANSTSNVAYYMSETNGWRFIMFPVNLTGSWGSTSSTNPIQWYSDPGLAVGHNDFGPGLSPDTNTVVAAGILGVPYRVRFDASVPDMLSAKVAPKLMSADAPFAGVTGSIAYQSYPSMRQYAAPNEEKRWFLDLHHLNPSYGSGAEVPAPVGPVSYTRVSGTSSVFKFTAVNGSLKYKTSPIAAFAGRYLLKDVSGPDCAISDANPWQYGVVLNAGECRSGSQPGEVYMSVPQASTSDNCVSNWYEDNFPCAFVMPAAAASAVQVDASRNDPYGSLWRRITMGFSGPGRQYQFGPFISEPSGKWGFMMGYWIDGMRHELMLAKLPPWPDPEESAIVRRDFVPVRVDIGPNQDLPSARVVFGYAENGDPSNFFCTSRQETCSTGGTPFAFDRTESPQWQTCQNGCTLTIPAIPGRVLYYRIDRRNLQGGLDQGKTQVEIP